MSQRTDLDLDLEERCRLLDEWVDKRRQIAALEAESYVLLVERIGVHNRDVSESPHHRDAIYRSMIAEYSAAGHIARGSIEYAFTDARTISRALPAVFASFVAGSITAHHVREIVRASEIVDDAIRDGRVEAATMGLYETAVLLVAEHDTASRTKTHARKVAAGLVGETVVETQRRATAERCVTVRSVGDGLAALTAILPEWVAVAISDRLTQMARHIDRTRDEREPILDPLEDTENWLHLSDLSPDDPRYDAYFEAGVIAADGTFVVDPLAGLIDPMTDPTSPDIQHLSRDTRTYDQIRADVLADLLLTAAPSEAERHRAREHLRAHPGHGRSEHSRRRRRSTCRTRRPRATRP